LQVFIYVEIWCIYMAGIFYDTHMHIYIYPWVLLV
jgi:hypothetical protein